MAKRSYTALFLSASLLYSGVAATADTLIKPKAATKYISAYFSQPEATSPSIRTRLQAATQALLGQSYALGPLGEGWEDKLTHKPRFRDDAFDCTTFVSTVLAMIHSQYMAQFEQRIDEVRYFQTPPSFLHRNHFMSVDWNPHNQALHLVRDVTPIIKDGSGKPLYLMARASINKPAWYQQQKNPALHRFAKEVSVQHASLNYLPLSALFDAEGRPIPSIFSQFPAAGVIEIVRPHWGMAARIGTDLLVSHIGFVLREGSALYLVHASASRQHPYVIKQPLASYLSQYRHHPTIKGIHVLEILPPSTPDAQHP